MFFSDDILDGRVNLDQYPFRYILIRPAPKALMGMAFSFGGNQLVEIDKVLTAVELLETRGWELLAVEQGGLVAIVRRVRR